MQTENEITLEQKISEFAPQFKTQLKRIAENSQNEAELRKDIQNLIDNFANSLDIQLPQHHEYTLFNGRADSVYNRLVIEYEPPRSLKNNNKHKNNQHAIEQVKSYIDGLIRIERHKPERTAGVVTDGYYFIFVYKKDDRWQINPPLVTEDFSVELFLKHLVSLSKEKALIPENLIQDFGENTRVSRTVLPALFRKLTTNPTPKTKALFEQWSTQFSEVCDYEEASKLKIEEFARKFGIRDDKTNPFSFFFCLHTYYAAFIKLLAVLIVQYYTLPRNIINLKEAANLDKDKLKAFLNDLENGSIFREYGILNFVEADFFHWYLEVWDDDIYMAWKLMLSALSDYSLLTLDVDPDTTRDLLKKLYEQLMPRELRHNLGEFYTPDWLAQYVLNLLEDGEYSGNPNKRVLDPACGSGTFLVMSIKKMQEYCSRHGINKEKTLDYILNAVVGFDLNPLAVISARTNYILALKDLLKYRTSDINIPVYLCDSIVTPHEGKGLFTKGAIQFNTAVKNFNIPISLIQAGYIDALSSFLEEAVSLGYSKDEFINVLCERFPLDLDRDSRDIDLVCELYEKLSDLNKDKKNGIWARIIKNAFAPLFIGQFDYVVGNPPWINWEHLPENYRKELTELWTQKYNLFPHKGFQAILGKAKDDISVLMTYVALDKYLKKRGILSFLITQSVFKSSGAGQGFRRFRIGEEGEFIKVLRAEDLVAIKPFEGAANRTAIIVLKKGVKTEYSIEKKHGIKEYLVPYYYWKKTGRRISVSEDMNLEEVKSICEQKKYYAVPVNEKDPTSPWLTGRPKAIEAIRKVLGKSDYLAHAGAYTGGANGVFWVEIIEHLPDGLVLISNITEGTKREVEKVQAKIEPDLLYPLLRGRDVKRWYAKPSAYIIMTHLPGNRLNAIPETEMKTRYPKTYQYLKHFEKQLRERAAYKRYFTRKDKNGRTYETGPFYSMFDVGDYTFAPYKVVWPWISFGIRSAVVISINHKCIIPEHNSFFIALNNLSEAYFICALLNSSIGDLTIRSFCSGGGGGIGAPGILNYVYLPKFDPTNKHHYELSELSKIAHILAKNMQFDLLDKTEIEINLIAAKIWDIDIEQLDEINNSLKAI